MDTNFLEKQAASTFRMITGCHNPDGCNRKEKKDDL
jgi:hypothetical protein